jgi:hypothetical protein
MFNLFIGLSFPYLARCAHCFVCIRRPGFTRQYTKRDSGGKGAKKIHAKTEIDAGPENWEEERPAAQWTAIEY